jgi:hypothetical protein
MRLIVGQFRALERSAQQECAKQQDFSVGQGTPLLLYYTDDTSGQDVADFTAANGNWVLLATGGENGVT